MPVETADPVRKPVAAMVQEEPLPAAVVAVQEERLPAAAAVVVLEERLPVVGKGQFRSLWLRTRWVPRSC